MSVDEDPINDERLDALLGAARWPQVSGEALRRSERTWAAVSPARRRWTWRVAAVAACLAVAGMVGVMMHRKATVTVAIRDPMVVEPARAVYPSRAPKMWEVTVVRKPIPRTPPAARATPVEAVEPETERMAFTRTLAEGKVDQFLKRVMDPETRDEALAAAKGMQRPPLAQLLAKLDDSHEAVRLAAARTLGEIDGPVTTAALARRLTVPAGRREALAALMCSEGPEAARVLAAARRDPGLGAEMRGVSLQLSELQ